MNSLKLRLPRFQFFYDFKELLKSLISLPFSDMSKMDGINIFLNEMENLFGRRHAHLASSFRMGFFHTLKSLDLGTEDEVLFTPITIADTVNSISLAGCRPVLVDIDPDTHAVCLSDLENKISKRSKVLLVTYLSGIVPDMTRIIDLAKKYNLIVIEDFSQAMDAMFKGKRIGSFGDVSIASLSMGKNISSLYGGLILVDDDKLSIKIKESCAKTSTLPEKRVLFYYLASCLKVQIATARMVFPFFVFNLIRLISEIKKNFPHDFKHDEPVKNNIFSSSKAQRRNEFPLEFYVPVNSWQIKLVHHQLKNLESGTRKRRELAQTLIDNLSNKSKDHLPKFLLNISDNNFYHFPIHCGEKKKEFRKFLFRHGIDNGSYGLNHCADEAVFGLEGHYPGADKVKYMSVFLPIHESYHADQMKHIAQTVNNFFGA